MATTPHYAPAAPTLWRRYLELTKPKVVALITFTAVVGTLLASPGLPPLGALVWGNLGIALRDQGDLPGAREQLERALAISESALGPDHPTVRTLRRNLGSVTTH